ncbi:hypothetical protein [Mesorhizobium sp.]|uniref:DUF6197 family protein n=1 Tax=Mesorhizobium sp. TaxID=1871066 RepID=UPI000FE501AC|nr:hypothetical protein [Mesorhizobium sp.]RWI35480.1 MAG: hypothetical protein EOR14_28675 [Mesorhizobium sp.]RWJ66351.1 MAG: hypothetical protein EOR34_28460 [Mesorhizobium sp.]
MKTALEIVEGMIELFDSSEKWVRDDFACNAKGQTVTPTSPTAICWCLQGAADKVAGETLFSDVTEEWDLRAEIKDAFEEALKPQGYVGMVHFNDDENIRFEDIVRLCERVVERLREKAA